ncbi:MAG: hypothetical protein U1F46_03115 [Marinagarivorans sp.]
MMKIVIVLILFFPFFAHASSEEKEMLEAVNVVFGPLNSKNKMQKGMWNKTKTAFAIAERIDDEVYKYVFLVKGPKNILPIKIGTMKKSDHFPKTGQFVAYYDRYEVESQIYGDVATKDLSVSYTYRAWKGSQRYTVYVKPIGIGADGTLDWSAY